MDPEEEDLYYRIRCRVIKIIASAMLAGLLIFIGLAAIVVMNDRQPPPAGAFGDLPILALMGCVLLAVNLPLSFILPRVMARNGMRQLASRADKKPQNFTGELINVWQTAFIVSRALLEAA